jgi:hypothetical protein
MIVQPAVEGEEIHFATYDPSVSSEGRLHLVERAGAALAGFHAAAAAPGPTRTFVEDQEELRGYLPSIAQAAPEVHGRFVSLVQRAARGTESTSSPPVASHGAFRTDQLLDGGTGLVMIDLDGFCYSSAARDIGNFLAYLGWRSIRHPEQEGFVEQAHPVFTGGYGSIRAAPDSEEIRLYQGMSLLKIAGRRFRNLGVDEWPLVPRLLESAARLLVG